MIADQPQTIVWAFTLSSRTSIWRFMAIWPSVETLFSITPLPLPHGMTNSVKPLSHLVTLSAKSSEWTVLLVARDALAR